jgi:hypothetical protein
MQWDNNLGSEARCIEYAALWEQIDNRKALRIEKDSQHRFLSSDRLFDSDGQFLIDGQPRSRSLFTA